MQKYTIEKATKQGEYDETYGQSWWCEVQGGDIPVKFSTKSHDDFVVGDIIESLEYSNRTSNKGVSYMQLKAVKKVGNTTPQQQAMHEPTGIQPTHTHTTTEDEKLRLLREIHERVTRMESTLNGQGDAIDERY